MATKTPPKMEDEKGINPSSFMSMMLAGAITYTLKNWDDYRAQVKSVDPNKERTTHEDEVWEDGRKALFELAEMLTLFSRATMDPDTGPEVGRMLTKLLAGVL